MCYHCSKCNQCGRFSYKTVLMCKSCNHEISAGAATCPHCGANTAGNIYAGKMTYDPNFPTHSRGNK